LYIIIWVGLSTLRQPPEILEDRFSLSVFCPLASRSPFQSVGNSLSAFDWLGCIYVAQGPWRGHACNTWHFLCVVSTHASARCVFTGAHTALLWPPFHTSPTCILREDRSLNIFLLFWSYKQKQPLFCDISILICSLDCLTANALVPSDPLPWPLTYLQPMLLNVCVLCPASVERGSKIVCLLNIIYRAMLGRRQWSIKRFLVSLIATSRQKASQINGFTMRPHEYMCNPIYATRSVRYWAAYSSCGVLNSRSG
jgi:hypothetical protein